MNSAIVSAWDIAQASQYNNLRKDLIVMAWEYATTTWSSNAYLLSIDSQYTTYTAWDNFEFRANFSNTWSATLNVNSLWAKTLKDPEWNTLWSWAIPNNWIVKCVYNWTDMICYAWIFATSSNKWFSEMLTDSEATTWTDETRYLNSKQAKDNYLLLTKWVNFTRNLTASSWTVTITHSLWRIPKSIKIDWYHFPSTALTQSHWKYDWTTKTTYIWATSWDIWQDTTNIIVMRTNWWTDNQVATISNITSTAFDLVWTKTWSPTWTAYFTADIFW